MVRWWVFSKEIDVCKKFVKKGTRVKYKNSSPCGILHQASDWVLLGDLDGNFSFPPHIAFIGLRQDITIFSNKLKRVILRADMSM